MTFDFLFQSIKAFFGESDKRIPLLSKSINGYRIIDLLLHIPRGYTAFKNIKQDDDINNFADQNISIELEVLEVFEKGSNITQVLSPKNSISFICKSLADEKTEISLKYLNGRRRIIRSYLKIGTKIIASGQLTKFDGYLSILHPKISTKYNANWHENKSDETIKPTYSLTNGITNDYIIAKVDKILQKLLPIIDQKDWFNGGRLSFLRALYILHNPQKYSKEIYQKASNRIKFDEFFARIYFAKHIESMSSFVTKNPIVIDEKNIDKFNQAKELLGFKLTQDQEKGFEFIAAKLNSTTVSTNIIQGDVGSGKTAVAILSCVYVVLCGYQTCVVCPTGILTNQHFKNFDKICSQIGIKVEILTSRDTASKKRKKLAAIANGEVDILISTHASFEDNVIFKNLAFVVVDEQQKFGVNQRLSIMQKGCFVDQNNQNSRACDMIMMTATPIPRTMFISLYHGMESFKIVQKPANRKPIITKVLSNMRLDELVKSLKLQIESGCKAYWVCPLIEESEKLAKTAVNSRFEYLKSIFGEGEVDIIHGQIKEDEREKRMLKFIQGQTKILVATTVIEVGVDVKDANIMIIENSESFGLSMLHQIRGRVGRGDLQSYCYFIYSQKTSAIGRQRLNVLKDSEDGFYISQEDLKMRGSGQVYGKMQSGFGDFAFFNQDEDDIIANFALQVLNSMDANGDENQINSRLLKILLAIFKYQNQNIISG